LLKQDEKLGRFPSSLYIWHTKAMTALVEYGTRTCSNSGQNLKPGFRVAEEKIFFGFCNECNFDG